MKTIEGGARLDAGYSFSFIELMKTQGRVVVALMLRDLKTRFFGSEFGFLISVAWPLTHILVLLGLYTALGRLAPYGDNAALWFATGIVPFMAFSYMSRFLMLGIVLNRPMLTFPAVKITDILFARALMEVLSAGLVIMILIAIFWVWGIDFVPLDIVQAFAALGACMLLGLGVGVINAIIAAAVPMWFTGFALIIILLWITSGVFFVPHALPEVLRYPLSFNPITHGIVWLCWGLVLERAVRGKLLR